MGRKVIRDPYPIYDRMRETGRVLSTPYGLKIVHRYEDGARFREWTEAITGTDIRGRTDPSRVAAFANELRDYLDDQIQQRKSSPTDDLIGRMVAANEEQLMSDAEVVASCVLLLIAG